VTARSRPSATTRVSAEPARAHLTSLRDVGAGTRSIAATAGVSRRTVADVRAGRRAQISGHVAEQLLAVTAGDLGPWAVVDAAPTRQLVRQLEQLGYPNTWVAAQLGSRARRPRLQLGDKVRIRTALAVAQLAERVGGRPNPDHMPSPWQCCRGAR
jgi:hypothetical protein